MLDMITVVEYRTLSMCKYSKPSAARHRWILLHPCGCKLALEQGLFKCEHKAIARELATPWE